MDLDQIAIVVITLIMAQQQQVTMTGNCCEQVVEIMCHTARQLANRLHFLALHELRFKRFQLGHIIQHSNQMAFGTTACGMQRHPQERILMRAGAAQKLRRWAAAAFKGFGQPVDNRASQPFEQVRQARAKPHWHRQKPPRFAVARQDFAAGGDFQQRDGQIFDCIPSGAGQIQRPDRFGRKQVNLAPPAAANYFGHKAIDGAFCPIDLMHPATDQR